MYRVLIIDDEQFSAETIKIILEDAGEAKADYSTSYESARELVKQSIKSNKPYEVFLIDLRLGPGKDGIEVMQDLRGISPDSDAIIFTGIENSVNGVRAYEAGAFRYLYKPFENSELLFLLKSLKQWRKEQQEHGWQKLFTGMMEEALRKSSFSEAADIVVQYALKLGFSRAHLFWVPTQEDANPDNMMIGIACAGRGCIPHFSGSNTGLKLYPLKQWFDLNRVKKAHEVIFYEPGEADNVQQEAEAMGYRWPKGEITFLPLWGSNRLLGEFMLDHGQQEKALSKHEFSLLTLFARLVAIVLENASLISREMRTVQETTTISQIGRQVTGRAAEETNLSELLDEVHEQISFLMDVSNFSVALVDPETGKMDIILWYEKGVRQNPSHIGANLEIENFLLNQEGGLFWQYDVAGHLQRNKVIVDDAEIPTSCIGVQLRVGKNLIGGIVAKNFDAKSKFTNRDSVLLSAVASQISGAIQLMRLNESERRDAGRLNVLRRASVELLRIGQKHEKDLWLTVLTIATSYFGINFDHALLMMIDDSNRHLNGVISVGFTSQSKPYKDISFTYDDFLVDLEKHNLVNIDPEELSKNIRILLSRTDDPIYNVIQYGHRVVVSSNETATLLPIELQNLGLSTCALLPLFGAGYVFGLVIVDKETSNIDLSEPSVTIIMRQLLLII